ncbi:MAG: hypothetical protein QOH71_3037 [Blastocatellia bacterium]|nr:hypothetical protein [Blastocatellia bacterium]
MRRDATRILRLAFPGLEESVSKVDFLTPKAFHNSAQGNTLGLGRAFEPTLKALNNDRMQPASE